MLYIILLYIILYIVYIIYYIYYILNYIFIIYIYIFIILVYIYINWANLVTLLSCDSKDVFKNASCLMY